MGNLVQDQALRRAKLRADAAKAQQKYYDKNKGDVNKKRRERYKTDPEYRARVLQQQNEAYLRRREKAPKYVRKPRVVKQMCVNGTTQNMYTVSQFAKAIRYSKNAVLKWELHGIIPIAMFKSKGGARLYTQAQVDNVNRLLKPYRNRKVRDWSKTSFPEKCKKIWNK